MKAGAINRSAVRPDLRQLASATGKKQHFTRYDRLDSNTADNVKFDINKAFDLIANSKV